MPPSLIAIVMAAGKSTRFKSEHSKLAQPVHGKSIIERVISAVEELSPLRILVMVGHRRDEVEAALSGHSVAFVPQIPQLGTGHCVQVAVREMTETDGTVLVLNGDVPLITASLLRELMAAHQEKRNALTLVSARLDDPSGYGRVVKDRSGKIIQIVEERDATGTQKRIQEINVGLYLFSLPALRELLLQLKNDNAQQEYYLTDLVEIFTKAQMKIGAYCASNPIEVLGVNDRRELAQVENILRLRALDRLMREGVTIIDPATTSIDDDARIAPDTVIYPGVRIEGATQIGARCVIRSHCRVTNSVLEDDVLVQDSSIINQSRVARRATIGPFAHLRLEAQVESEARVGNFVELKKARLGRGAKASHLTYLGDASVGDHSNIGAGTITCNYDGVSKNKTIIEEECFIGSGVELVAPVTVRRGAYVAAGSVITDEVPSDSLAIARSRQENKLTWKKKVAKRENDSDSLKLSKER